jgi:hypothetical protein
VISLPVGDDQSEVPLFSPALRPARRLEYQFYEGSRSFASLAIGSSALQPN